MATLENLLCLLAIVIAYGIAGGMDHDDAVMLDEAQRAPVERTSPDCLAQTFRSIHSSDARARQTARGRSSDFGPCTAGRAATE